ncbi:hypothetical protein GUJ93_ZPchr0458g22303 [Zizania palustris]|uniref:Cotton fiber protein n=1 Tax=Zizania palustris TaxID=103762 RepID=A0A8J5RSH0_ZIZPA|nr:hypothetical protein GUJ93_ZPchr0458g22303 [Zizania palustris]
MEALLPSSISPKINSKFHSHIYPQVGHVVRALAKLRSFLLDVLSRKSSATTTRGGGKKYAIGYSSRPAKSGKFSKVAGFMKLHFTWASATSITPARAKDLDVRYFHAHSHYDGSTWNVVVPADVEELRGGCGDDADDFGYLCWLEEERSSSSDDAIPAEGEYGGGDGGGDGNITTNEIDRLAERFIARCHAKFLLEKQESYRRYQEMMSRSI